MMTEIALAPERVAKSIFEAVSLGDDGDASWFELFRPEPEGYTTIGAASAGLVEFEIVAAALFPPGVGL